MAIWKKGRALFVGVITIKKKYIVKRGYVRLGTRGPAKKKKKSEGGARAIRGSEETGTCTRSGRVERVARTMMVGNKIDNNNN